MIIFMTNLQIILFMFTVVVMKNHKNDGVQGKIFTFLYPTAIHISVGPSSVLLSVLLWFLLNNFHLKKII